MGFAKLCASMNLISPLPEHEKPKNVALMFLNGDPERFFPCAHRRRAAPLRRCRRYRNRRIGEFLKKLHLTEGRNTGFRKIVESPEKNGSPPPEFETDEAHDYFITRIFAREGFYDFREDAPSGTEPVGKGTSRETSRDVILAAMRADPAVTVQELADLAGLTYAGARYHEDRLRSEGAILRRGSTKRGGWVVVLPE